MNATQTAAPVRIAANYEVTKRLGNWATAREFQVRAHRGHAVLDLRSPHIEAGEITVDVELDHAMLKLLVPDGASSRIGICGGWAEGGSRTPKAGTRPVAGAS